MNLSDVCKRLVMILVAVLAVALLGCAGTGGSPDCGECEADCESLSGEEKADCIELCVRDCTP